MNMFRGWRRSIKSLLVGTFVLVLTAMMGFFGADLMRREQQLLVQRQQVAAQDLSATLAVSAATWLLSMDVAGLQELIDAQGGQKDLEFAMLLDRHGRVLAHTDASRIGAAVLDLPSDHQAQALSLQSELVDWITPAFAGAVHVGWARVGVSQREARAQLQQLMSETLWKGGLATVLGSLLMFLIVSRLTQGLRSIQQVARRIESGDHAARVTGLPRNEVGQLARYFNHMLDRLQVRGQALEASERYNKALFSKSRVPMVVMDPVSLRFIDCNDAAAAIFRLPGREAVLGLMPVDVSEEVQCDGRPSAMAAQAKVMAALTDGSQVFEWRFRRPHGESWDAEVHLMVIDSQQTPWLMFTLTDITARKRAEREIEQLAFYDPLTQLPNRRLLMDRLHQAIEAVARGTEAGALILIDLDNFKTINDTQGHLVGDRLLIEVAHRLRDVARASDSVARLGGDEFVVLLRGLGTGGQAPVEAQQFVQRLMVALGRPWSPEAAESTELGARQHHCTASVGITLFQGPGVLAEAVLQFADTAMYKAKAAGRNAFRFFDPEMQLDVLNRVARETALRQAIRDGQLVLHFQPQVGCDGQVVGAEALVRWNHPQEGLLSPQSFIGLAEDTGLIIPLGLWVLESACRQLVDWAHDPVKRHWTLSVNVSPHQFAAPDFETSLLHMLRETGADARRLKIELTESVMMEDSQVTLARMRSLKAVGIAFAMDDFGTGYSSLSYLKRLPLDQLKIDRSFVRDVLVNAGDAAIARTIVALGRTLCLDVVAEGVETEAQRDFLVSIGCELQQGYLFGRPVPADELGCGGVAPPRELTAS